jgi:hypothetical protein
MSNPQNPFSIIPHNAAGKEISGLFSLAAFIHAGRRKEYLTEERI